MLASLLTAGPLVIIGWDKASTIGLACICALTFPFWGLWLPWYLFREFFSEASRGRHREKTLEEELKEAPRKHQVMFKGEKVPDWKITARVKATKAMLKFLSYTDNWFERKYVADVADEA